MNFQSKFDAFENKRILVIGDVMIDAYVLGKVNRMSPEAPVPIINLSKREERLGGAANVALNLVALGAQPIICSCIGKDNEADRMKELFTKAKVSTTGLVDSPNRMTTVKTRVLGNNQHIVRIDAEQTSALSSSEENALIAKVKELIEAKGIDGIIFEDYNKGVLTERLIHSIIELANAKGILTAVDPKKKNFFAYKGVTLFKPNLLELKEGTGLSFDFAKQRDTFEKAIVVLEEKLNNDISFVTLSEHGVFIKKGNRQHFIPAHFRNISDVSGAGDTVIAVATLCLLVKMEIEYIAAVANIAGGLVCEKSGVVAIQKEELLEEVKKLLH